jgi:hypothetical protein
LQIVCFICFFHHRIQFPVCISSFSHFICGLSTLPVTLPCISSELLLSLFCRQSHKKLTS